MHHNDNEVCVTVVDVTKQEIERPKKTARLVFRKEKTIHGKNIDYCGYIR